MPTYNPDTKLYLYRLLGLTLMTIVGCIFGVFLSPMVSPEKPLVIVLLSGLAFLFLGMAILYRNLCRRLQNPPDTVSHEGTDHD